VLGLAVGLTRARGAGSGAVRAIVLATSRPPSMLAASTAGAMTLGALFVLFLKVGLLAFGSGYVLVAFLRQSLVQGAGILTDQQLLDAIAVGQVTPGPVYTTATFIGYLVAGIPGAIVATVAIFLPGFVGIALVHRFIARLRASPVTGSLLDAVNAASLGLMAAVTVQLFRATVNDPVTLTLSLGSFGLLLRWPRLSVPLMLAGGAVGVVVHATGWIG